MTDPWFTDPAYRSTFADVWWQASARVLHPARSVRLVRRRAESAVRAARQQIDRVIEGLP